MGQMLQTVVPKWGQVSKKLCKAAAGKCWYSPANCISVLCGRSSARHKIPCMRAAALGLLDRVCSYVAICTGYDCQSHALPIASVKFPEMYVTLQHGLQQNRSDARHLITASCKPESFSLCVRSNHTQGCNELRHCPCDKPI